LAWKGALLHFSRLIGFLVPLKFDHNTLRVLMTSGYGRNCGQSLIDRLQLGSAVAVAMDDSSTLCLTGDAGSAMHFARAF